MECFRWLSFFYVVGRYDVICHWIMSLFCIRTNLKMSVITYTKVGVVNPEGSRGKQCLRFLRAEYCLVKEYGLSRMK
jgi:hypothetical protein